MSATCPLCGESNHCARVEAPTSGEACWCVGREFPAELLERVPNRDACICERCRVAATETR